MPPVAVFDTNILISSLLSLSGYPFRCIALAKVGSVESVTCREILGEFRDKLQTKFGYSPEQAARAADEVRGFSRVVPISGALSGVSPDPDDNKVLECAVIGEATHVVTGDRRHLLPLKRIQNIPIVTAAEFFALACPP